MTNEPHAEQWWACGLPEDGWQVRTTLAPSVDEDGWIATAIRVEILSPDRQTVLPVYCLDSAALRPEAARHLPNLQDAETNAIRIARILPTETKRDPK